MKKLEIVTVPYYDDNFAYLIHDASSGKTALVDCGEVDPILRQLGKNKWGLDLILATHFHYDHAGEIDAMKKHYPNAEVIKPADEGRLSMTGTAVKEGDTVPFGSGAIRILSLPAHTMFCTSYLIENNIFVGDTLFSAGCGRLFEGTPADLEKAMDKISNLPDETRIYFGHEYTLANIQFAKSIETENVELEEYRKVVNQMLDSGQFSSPTMVGLEKKINPFLRIDQPEVIQSVDPENKMSRTDRIGALRMLKDRF